MDAKQIFRLECKEILSQTRRDKIRRDNEVLKKLSIRLRDVQNKTILIYLPTRDEVNISKLFRHLRRHNRLLVPFMEGVSFKVVKFRLPLSKKKYSILEPPNSSAIFSSIDIAIVPVVGVDGSLRRIGYGKGMYDRFFASLKCSPYVIFVQRATCFTNRPIGDSYDVQADEYITPNNFIKRRGNHGIRTFDRRGGGLY